MQKKTPGLITRRQLKRYYYLLIQRTADMDRIQRGRDHGQCPGYNVLCHIKSPFKDAAGKGKRQKLGIRGFRLHTVADLQR